jgi:hypothetical protein
MYRPYWFDRISAALDENGKPTAWHNRFAGSSVIARWLPPGFKDGLDPDSTEGAIDLVYDLPNFHVEYVRVEPSGIQTAFWRSVGPSPPRKSCSRACRAKSRAGDRGLHRPEFRAIWRMGEAGTSAIVPAVTNAIFVATCKRLRKLPVDPAALKKSA